MKEIRNEQDKKKKYIEKQKEIENNYNNIKNKIINHQNNYKKLENKNDTEDYYIKKEKELREQKERQLENLEKEALVIKNKNSIEKENLKKKQKYELSTI